MTNATKKPRNSRIYLSIIGLVLLTQLVLIALTAIVVYPTEAHRQTARQMDEITRSSLVGGDSATPPTDMTTPMDSDAYMRLVGSPEGAYSNTASMIMALVNAIVAVAIVGIVYRYLRRNRMTQRLIGTTVLLVALGTLIPLLFDAFAMAMYLGQPMPGMGHIIFMLFIGIVMTPLVTAVFARIFQWLYNRKHSFSVE